jgi:Protein of unknown function (DUF2561)
MTALDTKDQTDRILLAVCAALWLAALGAMVAAIVALVDLASPHATGSDDADTPWLLYTVIAVSAVVIAGAIPLLIRARRTALDDGERPAAGQAAASPQNVFGPPLGTEGRQRSFEGPAIRRQPLTPATSRVGFPIAAVEQVWQRCSVALIAAIGAATAAVGVATYLLASAEDEFAWAAFGVAALVTVAMPVVPWLALRQLHHLLA